jgi:hypothetical protein
MAEQQMCQPLYREFQSFRLFICTLIIIFFFLGLGTSRYERVVIGAWVKWCFTSATGHPGYNLSKHIIDNLQHDTTTYLERYIEVAAMIGKHHIST